AYRAPSSRVSPASARSRTYRSSADRYIWNGAPWRSWRAKLPEEPKASLTAFPVVSSNAAAISPSANCRSDAAATTGSSASLETADSAVGAAAAPAKRHSAARRLGRGTCLEDRNVMRPSNIQGPYRHHNRKSRPPVHQHECVPAPRQSYEAADVASLRDNRYRGYCFRAETGDCNA